MDLRKSLQALQTRVRNAVSLVSDKLSGKEAREIDRVRRRREDLEVRLARRQVNYALDRYTRAEKNATGERGRTYRQALELAAKRRQELGEPGRGLTRDEELRLVSGALPPTSSGMELAGGIAAGQPQPPAEADERDEVVLHALESDLPIPEEYRTEHGDRPGAQLTPVQRGSFVPTVDEVLNEIIPPDISSEEERLRWRELRLAEKTYARKVKKRKPGVAKCQSVPIDGRGHDWMKVPGQSCWECMGCGVEASIGLWQLRDGKMHEVAAYKQPRAQRMFKALADGNVNFLLPRATADADNPAPTLGGKVLPYERNLELPKAERERLELVRQQCERPEVPEGMRADPMAALEVQSLEERPEYKAGPENVCQNCGAVKAAHKELHTPLLVSGLRLERSSLRCPQHGVDAT